MSRFRFGVAAVAYALVIAYASTIIGVAGPHYVPIAWDEALHALINMPYIEHGSDQRSDWMGNVMMLVPLGFLVAGLFAPERISSAKAQACAALFAAVTACLALIVAVKYAQLFFPPRTVTLNYLIAQCLGAGTGILLLGLLRSPLAEIGRGMGPLESLRLLLRIYTGLLIVFMLMPLDFALSLDDLAAQVRKLPATLSYFSGDNRPLVVRLALILAGVLASGPIGALLTLVGRDRIVVGRPTVVATGIGFVAMIGVYAATTMVISGSASLPTAGFRTIGIMMGAWLMHWLSRQNPEFVRHALQDCLPWVLLVYVLTLFAVNGLLSLDWTTLAKAWDNLYPLGLLPLFNYYIVTKAQAAKNIVGHMAMYAPIGVMIWLRAANGGGKTFAFLLAATLSAIVELARFLRPGLVPDINAIPLAGMTAWFVAGLMPPLWGMFAAVSIGQTRTGTSSAGALRRSEI